MHKKKVRGGKYLEIKIKELTKNYGDYKAVCNMNLTIADGELVSLLGPSGCGKSTTLFMLAGLIEPSGGQIFFGEKDVTNVKPEDREIGFVFQNYALYPHMSVLENITFPLINRKVKKEEAKAKACEIAKLVQIDELMDRKPKELSGGQQQRVAIARALVKKPKVLLLDEPLSNLDAKLRIETREEIRRIQQEVKITTIFVTHDQEEAMSISDRMAVMERGVVQQYEIPQTIYNIPTNRFVARFLGIPQINEYPVQIKEKQLYFGDTCIVPSISVKDGDYFMGIRPESVLVSFTGGDYRVKVEHIRMTGKDLLLHVSLGDMPLKAFAYSDTQIQAGDLIYVSFKKEQMILFDKNGQTIGKY